MLSSLSFSREIVLVSSKTFQTGPALSAVQGQPGGFRDSGQLLGLPTVVGAGSLRGCLVFWNTYRT